MCVQVTGDSIKTAMRGGLSRFYRNQTGGSPMVWVILLMSDHYHLL